MFEEDQVPLAGEEAKFSEPSPVTNVEVNTNDVIIERLIFDAVSYFNKFDEIIAKAENGNLEIEELDFLKQFLFGGLEEDLSLNYKKFDRLAKVIIGIAYPKEAKSIRDCNQHYIDLLLELDKKMYFGPNILNEAIFIGDIETVKILLDRGKIYYGAFKEINFAQELHININRGFDAIFKETPPFTIAKENINSLFPLDVATTIGDSKIVQILLESNVNIALIDSIKTACVNKRLDIVQCLIERSDIKLPANIGAMPLLLWSCLYGNDEIVKTLIERGGNINSKYHLDDIFHPRWIDGQLQLGYDYNIISLLCRKSLDVNANFDLIFSAIKRAIKFGVEIYPKSDKEYHHLINLYKYKAPLRDYLQEHMSYLNKIVSLLYDIPLHNISFESLKAYQKYKGDIKYLIKQSLGEVRSAKFYAKIDSLIAVSSADSLEGVFANSDRAIIRTTMTKDIIDRNISPFLTPYDIAKLDKLIAAVRSS